jgi:RHS repeat-associated protein
VVGLSEGDLEKFAAVPAYAGVKYRMKWRYRGGRHYELCNHLGNVQVVVTDKKIAHGSDNWEYYTADVYTASDYGAFGMEIEERGFIRDGKYRYGFIRKEKDDEIAGEGNSYNFGDRMYDSRLCRWTAIDPMFNKYPALTPYCYGANSPEYIKDDDGRDIIVLSEPKGANGFGHAAVLIGDDNNGWYYYSKNGTNGSSETSGESNKNPRNGIYYKTLGDFANSNSTDGKIDNFDSETGEVLYTSAFRIKTSSAVDEKMKKAASAQVLKPYKVIGASCIDVPSDALEAGGLDGGTKLQGRSDRKYKPDGPNSRYKLIVTNNDGKIITPEITPSKEVQSKFREASPEYKRAAEKGQRQLDEQNNPQRSSGEDFGSGNKDKSK